MGTRLWGLGIVATGLVAAAFGMVLILQGPIGAPAVAESLGLMWGGAFLVLRGAL